MADENPTGTGAAGPSTDADLDLRAQVAILDLVLRNWPVHLTDADLLRTLDAEGFEQRDRIDRAIRDLYDIGLVLRCFGAVLPTRAALHFERLEEAR